MFQKRDVYRFLANSVGGGYLDKIESDMIRKLIANGGLPVRNIAVPRTDIVAAKLGTGMGVTSVVVASSAALAPTLEPPWAPPAGAAPVIATVRAPAARTAPAHRQQRPARPLPLVRRRRDAATSRCSRRPPVAEVQRLLDAVAVRPGEPLQVGDRPRDAQRAVRPPRRHLAATHAGVQRPDHRRRQPPPRR